MKQCFLRDKECSITCQAWSAHRNCCILLRYVEQLVEWGEAEDIEEEADYA
jgi:hypothetical protein